MTAIITTTTIHGPIPGDGWDAWSNPGDYYDDGWGDYFG